jgi:hypothetical protein
MCHDKNENIKVKKFGIKENQFAQRRNKYKSKNVSSVLLHES